MVRHLLEFNGYRREEIDRMIEMAMSLKRKGYPDWRPLSGKCILLFFEKPSTRTRVSFHAAISKLGGDAVSVSPAELQLSRGEPISDTARALSGYVDAIAARVNRHETLVELSRYSSIPVINALSDKFHPCQALADMMTVKELKGGFRGVKLAYVGDGNNVCNSLIQACALLGAGISVACPRNYRPLPEVLEQAEAWMDVSGGMLELTEDPGEAVEGADIIYTDVFVSMGQEAEREERLRAFYPAYRVTESLFSKAKPDAVFMHCLPAHRGEEVDASIIDGSRSVVWQQAENRMHTEAVLLLYLLKETRKV